MKLKELLEITGENGELQIKIDDKTIFVGNKRELKQRKLYAQIYNCRINDTNVFASYLVINLNVTDKKERRELIVNNCDQKTILVMGTSGPTGKSSLVKRLQEDGYIALEMFDIEEVLSTFGSISKEAIINAIDNGYKNGFITINLTNAPEIDSKKMESRMPDDVYHSYIDYIKEEDAKLSAPSPIQEEKKEPVQLNLSDEAKELIEKEFLLLTEAEELAKRLFHLEKTATTNVRLIDNIVKLNDVKQSIEDICYKYKDMNLLEHINQTAEIKKGGK